MTPTEEELDQVLDAIAFDAPPRLEHNYRGNCNIGKYPDEACEEHDAFRGECTRCPPCAACDLEWDVE